MNRPILKVKDVYRLLAWYRANKRDLPWRHTNDPYRIWVSEIMLQQTRVEAVKPYYASFLSKYPDVKALAEAKEDDLTRIWEGLGYYSRVRNMHKAAMEVNASCGGLFPVSYEVLLTLPGIGSYTAGAVASIAGGENVPAVDGNVLRVYTRIMADDGCISDAKTVKRIREEIAVLMHKAGEASEKGCVESEKGCAEKNDGDLTYRPGDFNAAMMEVGATVCLPNGEPKCGECPFAGVCKAYKEGRIGEYPKKAAKAKRRIENRTVFVLESTRGIALKKRPGKGLLAGMYELPAAEGFLTKKQASSYIEGLGYHPVRIREIEESTHVFSHIEWHMKAFHAVVDDIADPSVYDPANGIFFVTKEERKEGYALPSAFKAYKKYIF